MKTSITSFSRLFFIVLLMSVLNINAQQPPAQQLTIGEPMPDRSFANLTHSEKKDFRISDYKGKIVILDFWATWCGACIANLPHLNELQNKFQDKLQVLLIDDEKKEVVDAFFKNMADSRNTILNMPSLYSDYLLRQYFPHRTIPHSVVINQEGKVVAIPFPDEITVDKIQRMIQNIPVNFNLKEEKSILDENKPFFNEQYSKPLFAHQGLYGQQKIPYKSVLTHFIDGRSRTYFWAGRFICQNSSLVSLIRNSYSYSLSNKMEPFYNNRMILEVKNPEKYIPKKLSDHDMANWFKENGYVYDLVFPDYYKGPFVPPGSDSIRKYSCEVMKKDLEEFSGLHSSLEKRKVDCLVLTCSDSTKVNSNENFGSTREFPGRTGEVFNYPKMEFLIRSLKLSWQYENPLIDETKYSGKVNIKLNALMTNVDAVNEELKKFGLQILKEPRVIDMLVIKDK